MPLLPEAAISRIKSTTDLAAYVRSCGIPLKPHGTGDLIGHCPFHHDKTPSFVVTPSKNLWHCLGACQTGGSIIDFVMKTERKTFREAALQLGGPSLLSEDEHASASQARTFRPRPFAFPFNPAATDQELLNQVTTLYTQTLAHSEAAKAYLHSRGLGDAALHARFRIGYADRTLGLSLPRTKEPGGLRDRLLSLGVMRETTGHEHFAGCVVIPILDAKGNTLGLYGRRIQDHVRQGAVKHLYLKGAHQGVFNSPLQLSPEGDVILCESIIDALTFIAAGFTHTTCAYGVEGFTEEIETALFSLHPKRIFIAYDRDEAGDRAALKLVKRWYQGEHPLSGVAYFGEKGLACHRVLFPHGEDVNSFCQGKANPSAALELTLQTAPRMDENGVFQLHALPPKDDTQELLEEAVLASAAAPPLVATVAATMVAPIAATESAPVVAAVLPEPETPALPVSSASSPAFAAPAAAGEDLLFAFENRQYRIRGLYRNTTHDHLRVNLRLMVGETFFLDQVDLYASRQREAFIQNASLELRIKGETIKNDLTQLLIRCEKAQENHIRKAQESVQDAAPPMSRRERDEALSLLQDPELMQCILLDLDSLGVIGEKVNKLCIYLAFTSRKMDKPLGLMVQSQSSAGKSSLLDAVLSLFPSEDVLRYSAMTGQSLYYLGEKGLKHKILSICEEEGARRASYALKLLQSDGHLTIATAEKDEKTGRHQTGEYKVEGPVALALSSAQSELDEELQNRLLTLCVDESREQTRRIHQRQRENETLQGLMRKEKESSLRKLHQNAQRLLRPLQVVNPYAEHLTFVDGKTRTRRDHVKYLTLIRAVTLLHQYQREVKTRGDLQYIETTLEDIAIANRLAHEVLGTTLDELSPQTRGLLTLIEARVRTAAGLPSGTAAKATKGGSLEHIRFTRRDVREWSGLGHSQLALHLKRLEEMEYLLPIRGRQGSLFEYALLYRGEGKEGQKFLPGLIDVAALRQVRDGGGRGRGGEHGEGEGDEVIDNYDPNFPGLSGNFPGVKENFPAPFRGVSGGVPGAFRDGEMPFSTNDYRGFVEGNTQNPENGYAGQEKNTWDRSSDHSSDHRSYNKTNGHSGPHHATAHVASKA